MTPKPKKPKKPKPFNPNHFRKFLRQVFPSLKMWAADLPGWLRRGPSPPWGLHLAVGPQGCGKTLFTTIYAADLRRQFGDRIAIVSNYGHQLADYSAPTAADLIRLVLTERADRRPLIVLVDEIATWWSSTNWNDVPQDVIGLIAQQRKRRICLLATVQNYRRLALAIREQTRYVWTPRLWLGGRLLAAARYPGMRYSTWYERSSGFGEQEKLGPASATLWFAVRDSDRDQYDTTEVIRAALKAADEAPKNGRRRKTSPPPKGGENKLPVPEVLTG
jgi:hypothetical protein